MGEVTENVKCEVTNTYYSPDDLCILCTSPAAVSSHSASRNNEEANYDNNSCQTNLENVRKLIVKSKAASLTGLLASFNTNCSSSSAGDDDDDGIDAVFEETLDHLERENCFVCSVCNKLTLVALESRSKVEEREIEVRLLQQQLLQLLRKLQEEMAVFNEEMGKIGGVVKRSSQTVREETKSHATTEGMEQEEKWQKCQKREEKTTLVRERILDVVTELRFFQSYLDDKLSSGHPTEGEVEVEDPSVETPLVVPVVNDYDCNVEMVTCEFSLTEEEGDNIPVIQEVECSDVKMMDYPNYIGHYILGGGDEEIEEDNNDTSILAYRPTTPPPPPRKKSLKSFKKSAKFKRVNLSKVCSFKKGLIKRAIEREMKRKQDEDLHENPLIRYYLRYDPPSDSFFVGDTQIKLQKVAGQSRLECTGPGCSAFWTSQGNNGHTTTFDRDIRNHVIGQHLGGFSCRVCTVILNSYYKLMSHFKKQHPGQKPLNDYSSSAASGRGKNRDNSDQDKTSKYFHHHHHRKIRNRGKSANGRV